MRRAWPAPWRQSSPSSARRPSWSTTPASPRAPSLELSEAQWQGALDVNLSGVFRVAQASAREMVRAGTRGTIINIASILGLRVRAQVAAYAASTYRVVYTARLAEIVVVLHAFQKKTQATPKREIELARERWVQLQKER